MSKIIALSALALTTTTMTAQNITYPKAPQDGTIDTYFGVKVADPFRPLEDDRSPATAAWVEAENQVTNAYLSKIPFRAKLLKRLKEVADFEKVSTPFKKNDKWYVYKNNGLQNQSVLYQMDELGGPLREFLDPNKLSDDGTVALQSTSFSKDGKYMAYVISRSGSDWQEIYVKDIATGELLTDHIEWAKFGGAQWCGNGFYYSAYDAPEKGKEFSSKNEVHKVYYHKIGTPQSQDVLFYQNPAYPLRFYSVSINDEETIMFLYESGAGSGQNVYVRDLRVPNAQFIQMTSNLDMQYNPIGTIGDNIYMLTNDGAPRGRVMVANIHKPGFKDWKELVPESKHMLDNVEFADDKMVLTYNQDASTHLYLYTIDGKEITEIKLPTVGRAGFSSERGQKECFYSFSSFTVPGTIYQYDIAQNKSTLYTAPKVKFDLNKYTTQQVFFTSKDGTRVPMFLTYKKDMKRNGKNPVFLYGYGGFNVALPPSFSSMRIPFLENGGIYVQVNLRGGSEYGEEWHVAGTKMQKQNVFDDFISAAEWLITNNFTSKNHIAIVGGSNGGLLVGACMTQRPDLFKVCIPQVGVMDMLRYHKFTIGWNWAPDYGTSEDSKEMFQYLYGYSPLHNLKKGVSYPATLVTTADHDDRVVPAHSFKFAATLQECQGGSAPVLIRIDSKAGHGSGKPLAKQLEEQADIYSFIMYNMGMKFK
ncbi:prolyl oligopeptidase family serine peptidase [Prevotella aurantiaca JCM 15754]|jgi:putative prolyl endopeptidase|uniref:prolyl oligopeptidase n=1 Tax=Prevotella aurantiaca TaxID=596085 RepID=A0A930HKD8_9BACT|nr:prolyl oligopeptidase family serine peptidase [Prevotella aurantiaca]MBF1383308.1 S9 family peptidase [Prevotella aurantiaca]MBF1386207.1 S9 family peptidase [Prevotella aurantiaca]